MGIELARAFISIRADASNLDSGFQAVRAQTESALAGLAAGAAALLAPVAAFGRGVLSQGIGLAKSFEMSKVEFEVMTGSAEEAETTLKRLTKFAVDTPFEMPQLLQVSRGLVAAGERGGELMQTLRVLGDASLGSAAKFTMLGSVYNQIRDRGKLTADNFRQLTEAGVISSRDLAKYFGVSVETIAKKMEAGQISFAHFKAAMQAMTGPGGRLHNMMEKQSKTLEGLSSTLRDTVNITKRMIAEPLVPYLKAAVSAAIGFANCLSAVAGSGGEVVSFAVVGATAFASLGAAFFAASFAARLFGISLRGALIGSGVGLVIVALGAALGALVGYFEVPRKIGEGFAWLKRQMTGGVEVVENLRDAYYRLRDGVASLYVAVSPLVRVVGLAFSRAFLTAARVAVIGLNAAALSVSDFVLNLAEWFEAVSTHWRRVWDNFSAVSMVAFSYLVDVAGNAAAGLLHAFRGPLRQLVSLFFNVMTELSVAMDEPMRILEGRRYDQKVVDEIRRAGKAAAEAAKTGLGLEAKKPPDLFEESARTKTLRTAAGVDDLFKDIEKTKRELEKKRQQRRKKLDEPDDDKGGGPKPSATPVIPAGIYAIEAFGKKIQEVAAKTGEDPAVKTNALLGDGLALQKQMLDGINKIPGVGGLKGD